ncbi:hypothetical protein [Amycolatopsis sp. WGS_07]|uniref:hypothetical protein n=1 Tax=Amycolatopsis sp. WGS_07 TaxID=3076764 RepID=UPI003873C64E
MLGEQVRFSRVLPERATRRAERRTVVTGRPVPDIRRGGGASAPVQRPASAAGKEVGAVIEFVEIEQEPTFSNPNQKN